METLSTFNLMRWANENQHLFNPPFRTNQLIVHHKDFLVMVLRGPNTRLDFHIEPGDEFFYQIEGDMELHLKPPGERREVVTIKQGEIFVCPGDLPHSPRRFENTWGLVIERKRRDEEKEEFEKMIAPLWYFLHETKSRVPFTDWYDTVTGRQIERCTWLFPG